MKKMLNGEINQKEWFEYVDLQMQIVLEENKDVFQRLRYR